MRVRIAIGGIVQGVGFRPAVYREAMKNELTGFVFNTDKGVTVEVQGREKKISEFSKSLQESPPPAARIDTFISEIILPLKDEEKFSIIFSKNLNRDKTAGISPDLATCPECIAEIKDPRNRRHGYPFANCTNCGPRFTIIRDRPYDRALTTMRDFGMCSTCRKEYEDPENRRFHAQPNACPDCGPTLQICIADGKNIRGNNEAFHEAVTLLKAGKTGAIKGLGGFHFVCDPLQSGTVDRLRKNKDRPNKAFALMLAHAELIRRYCLVSPEEEKALTSPAAPIVLLRKKNTALDFISPDNNYLGVMLPFTPLHHLLMDEIPLLIMTSANRHDEPLAVEDREVRSFMEEGLIDFYLSHNREIAHRCDDSIVQFSRSGMQFIRRSRGYVPLPVSTVKESPVTTLSLGANLKNTFALRSGEKIYLSQHMGDLMDYRNLEFQKSQVEDFSRLLDVNSRELRCDAHKYYENYRNDARPVFHHHAHMLSVMAENNLYSEPLTGVICDGTGAGSDETVWGFEFLRTEGDPGTFRRLAHLDVFELPGGEAAIRETDRIAIALAEKLEGLPFTEKRIGSIKSLIKAAINCPETSSLGRLFDGVSALCGLTSVAEYEARGAMLLQREAEKITAEPADRYGTAVTRKGSEFILNHSGLIKEILYDLEKGQEIPRISWKFHRWTADSIIAVLNKLEKTPVILSGGCFQNLLLLEMVEASLDKENYTYYINRIVPPNDGGISLGQAYPLTE